MQKTGDTPSIVQAKRQPSHLKRLFMLFSVLSVIIILLLSGLGIYRIYRYYIIRDAEKNSMGIAYAVFEQEKELLMSSASEGRQVMFVNEEHFPALDERMKKYLHPMNMLKIKFFDAQKRIVYSNEHSVVGKVDDANLLLAGALRGEVASKLVRKGSVTDLAGEKRSDVDVVETYLPIVDHNHDIVGAFEVYVDVTPSYREIRRVVASTVAVLLVALSVVFLVLVGIMSKATRRLHETQRELEEMAITDGLTKVYNRRYLIDRAEEEFEKLQRKRIAGLGIIMIDVDNFKQINDTCGHLVGDEVLRAVAGLIGGAVRRYDIVGRFGGEEFLIVLPGATIGDVKSMADRIRTLIRETPVTAGDRSLRVTVSAGVAVAGGSERNIDAVINKADEGLYKAKRAGKDRISWVA